MKSTQAQRSWLHPKAHAWRAAAVLALGVAALMLLGSPRTGSSAVALEVFDTPGMHGFVVPEGVTEITVEAWGSGGGGGGALTLLGIIPSANIFQAGAGGGGGAYARSTIAVVPGQTYAVTVAAPGQGGTGGVDGDDGTNGAASSFEGHGHSIVAGGGAGGAGGASGEPYAGGAGGSVFGSTGDTLRAGGDGGDGGIPVGGGGGGGAGGASADGGDGGDGSCTGGPPCTARLGGIGGGGGAGGVGASFPGDGLLEAGAGTAPGGGGGGGVGYGDTASDGADGAPGRVHVSWGSDPPGPPAGPGCASPSTPHGTFSPVLGPSGISIAIWGGGSVALFPAAISYWATHMGALVGFIPGAPAFVNATFIGAFTDNVPPCTGFIVRR